jgi:hypothetical protein
MDGRVEAAVAFSLNQKQAIVWFEALSEHQSTQAAHKRVAIFDPCRGKV